MLDQGLKYLMLNQGLNNPIVIGGTANNHFIKLELIFNKGAAFGMGSSATIFLTIISFIATIALIIICTKFNNWKKNKTQAVALTLILAGTAGNLFDRFMTINGVLDGVVDMIYFRPFEWVCELVHMGYGVFNLTLYEGFSTLPLTVIKFSSSKCSI